jgi:hypothetical protein
MLQELCRKMRLKPAMPECVAMFVKVTGRKPSDGEREPFSEAEFRALVDYMFTVARDASLPDPEKNYTDKQVVEYRKALSKKVGT